METKGPRIVESANVPSSNKLEPEGKSGSIDGESETGSKTGKMDDRNAEPTEEDEELDPRIQVIILKINYEFKQPFHACLDVYQGGIWIRGYGDIDYKSGTLRSLLQRQ